MLIKNVLRLRCSWRYQTDFDSLLCETVAQNFGVRSRPGASVAGGRRGDRIARNFGSCRIGSGGYKDAEAYFISAKPSQGLAI